MIGGRSLPGPASASTLEHRIRKRSGGLGWWLRDGTPGVYTGWTVILRPATRALQAIFLGVAILAIAPGSGHAARGGEAADPTAKVFEERARIVAVEVPVNVTDRQGEPVRNLTADDFEIQDEGTIRTLTGFEVVDLGTAGLETADQEGKGAAAEPPLASADLPSSARRHFMLLFDISFSDPNAVVRGRQAARDFVLRHLHPTDLVAVATYSLETGPQLVLTFTPDRRQVAHAIDSLGLHYTAEIDPLRFLISPTERPGQDASGALSGGLPDITSNAQGAYLAMIQRLAEQMDRSERSFKASQITYFTRSMSEMARILASIDGRKHVVLFSEGFDSRLLTGNPLSDTSTTGDNRTELLQAGEIYRVDSDNLYGNTGLQRKLREMVREFRRADCVIQAVDIGGLRAEGDIRGQPLNVGHEGLFYMAHETGGELFKDTNDLEEQLREVLKRNSVTYVLSFEPTDLAFDGRFHRLRVRLKDRARRDYRLSYRQGYYEPRPFQELHPLEKDLLASDAIASASGASEIDVDVLAAPFRANEHWAYVPVIVEVDGEGLLAGHHEELMTVEIYSYATNSEGEMQGFFTEQLTVDLSKGRELIAAKGIKYYGHLELPPGEFRLRVLVRNALTGVTAVRALPVVVPEYRLEEAVVLPPFFLEEPGRWLMIREQPDQQRSDSTIYPFTVKGQPYVPAAKPQLSRGEDAQLCLVAYNLSNGDLSLDGKVMTAEGRSVTGGKLRLMERTTTGIEGYDKLLASFKASNLDAGDYTLHIALTEESTGRSRVNSIPFRVFH